MAREVLTVVRLTPQESGGSADVCKAYAGPARASERNTQKKEPRVRRGAPDRQAALGFTPVPLTPLQGLPAWFLGPPPQRC